MIRMTDSHGRGQWGKDHEILRDASPGQGVADRPVEGRLLVAPRQG